MKFRTFVCSSLISLVSSLGPAAHAQTAPATRRVVSVMVQSVSLTNDSSISSEHLQLIEEQILLRPFAGIPQIAQAAMRKLNTEGYLKAQAEVKRHEERRVPIRCVNGQRLDAPGHWPFRGPMGGLCANSMQRKARWAR